MLVFIITLTSKYTLLTSGYPDRISRLTLLNNVQLFHQNTKKTNTPATPKQIHFTQNLFVLLPHDLHLSQTRKTQKPKAD